jgi:hypothetical protein
MTSAIVGPRNRRRLLRSWLLVAGLPLAGCSSAVEVSIATPLEAKLDMTRFKRLLVAGFIADGNEAEVDVSSETVRLLQNHLRSNTKLRVLEPDQPPIEDALEKLQLSRAGVGMLTKAEREQRAAEAERLLGDQAFWRRLGEEFQQPLILTGRLAFETRAQTGFEADERQVRDPYGELQRVRDQRLIERRGFSLTVEFHFVDGRTGQLLHKEKFTEEVLYSEEQKASALSAYFELMDRLLPNVLGVISTQRMRGSRFLIP